MAGQPVELTGSVPEGWISVEPKVVNESAASMVLLRAADLDAPFTANITVAERIVGPGDDIAARAESYRTGLAGRSTNLVVERADMLSASPPRQFAQDLRFTVNVAGCDMDLKQSQFLFEIPTEQPKQLVLVQLLYTAPVAVYDSAKSAVVEFMGSISAHREDARDPNAGHAVEEFVGVRKEHLEARVKDILERSVGRRVDEVVCNGGLRAEVGAVQRCALAIGGDRLGVTVTASAVDDGNVKFDIEVDKKPMV